jgi:hypothetical protein
MPSVRGASRRLGDVRVASRGKGMLVHSTSSVSSSYRLRALLQQTTATRYCVCGPPDHVRNLPASLPHFSVVG